MPQKKKLKTIPPEDAAISNYLMQKNKDKNFVQRAYNNNTAPRLQTNTIPGYQNAPSNQYSTELMSYDPGSQRVYPDIVQRPGQKGLEYLGGDKAWNYADSSGEYINMPPSEKVMDMFSNYGYKHASGIPIYAVGGPTKRNQWDLPSSPQTPGYQDYGSMYTVPQWPGLMYKDPGQGVGWEGYGNPQNLIANQQQEDNWQPIREQPTRQLAMDAGEYSIDRVREQYQKGGQTMKVKILKVPGQSTIPENRVNPFSVPDTYKYGGNLPNQGGNPDSNRRIDTYSDFLRQPMKGTTYQQSPYSATGKQLPEVPEGTEDAIVVEKQEQIMGDFNNDGMPVLMGVNAGSHESGQDQKISVPDNSFIFSDTPSLKIKDPQILEMFGKKKPMTPAQIAKQYDLQNYKKILDDKERGEVDKNTARLMYSNYTDKLNLLASVQEDMKKKQDEMKQNRQYKKGGNVPRYDEGGRTEWELDEYNVPRPVATITANRPDKRPLTQDPTYSPPYVDVPPFTPYQDSMPHDSIDALPTYSPYITSPVQSTMNTIPVPGQIPFRVGTDEQKGIGNGKKEQGYNSRHPFNPDTLAGITAGMRALQYPAYNPIRQVANGAIPQPVYLDPTRAKAAIQEGVNSASNAIAMGANGPVSRANILALQGKAGSDASNVEAQYAQQNAQIANRTNEQAAQIYNDLWKNQQSYNKEYVEDTHNAQMDKLGYQATTQNELLKQAYLAENRKRTAHNYNYINPYYTIDSRGYIYPKSEEQIRATRAIGEGRLGSTSSSTPVQDAEMIIKAGNYSPAIQEEIRKRAAIAQLHQMQGPKQTRSYNANTGSYDPSKETGYEDAFSNTQKRGGLIKKSKVKIVGLPS